MASLTEILNYSFYNNSVQEYLVALGILIISIVILKIFKYVIIQRIKKIAERTKTDLDDLIIKIFDDIQWPFYLFIALYISIQFIQIPDIVEKILGYALYIVLAYYTINVLQDIINYAIRTAIKKKGKQEQIDESALDLLSKFIKGLLWGILIIFFISNLGYDVSTLIAGLGIGGIAIAFALQNVLSDVFASFSIYFDKPFQTGDFIIIGNDMGVVKRIGIKSTRIQTLQGQELIVSNKELTETRVNNYKKMEKRRIAFNFGVTYGTSTAKLKKIPKIIKDIIDKIEITEFDRAHFKQFGDFSLNFEVVYYIDSNDYNVYMDTQQQINLLIKEKFEKGKIEMAFPTQTIFLNKSK